MRDNGLIEAAAIDEDQRFDVTLRTSRFDDFVGQDRIKDNLKVFVQAALGRRAPLDHGLFCAPRGVVKTTVANIRVEELGVSLVLASGPAMEHKGQLASLVTKLNAR